MKMEIERTFTQEEYNRFASLSGDFNPIHVDEEFSANSGFGKTVAHGIFLTTCLSGVLEKLVGEFSFLSSKIMFPAPTYTNVEMVLSAQLIDENSAKLVCREKESGQETCTIDVEFSKEKAALSKVENPKTAKIIEPEKAAQKPFSLGQKSKQIRVFSQDDINEFVALGGHLQNENQVSPIFVNAMFSKLLGIDLPGLGTNYLKQETQYHSPIKIGEEISAIVEITRIREDKKIIDFSTNAFGEDKRLIASGRALVSARDVSGAF